MRVPAWEGDWHARLKERLEERGFDTVTAFTDSQPTASLLSLSRQLCHDKDIAAVQLQWMLVEEAEDRGTIERCARGLLVRELHEALPEGWLTEWDEPSWFRLSAAYGAWGAALGKRYQGAYRRVWDVLVERTSIPEGWLPAGPNDPILLEAFKHWNEPG